MFAGWSTIIAGAYRVHLLATGEAKRQVTRWDCVTTPHFVVMTYSLLIQTGMLLLISLDRLIAVLRPLQYNAYTRKYSIYMLTACIVPSAMYVVFVIVYVRAFDSDSTVTLNALCVIDQVDILVQITYYIRLTLASLSVIAYAIVWILFRKHRVSMNATLPSLKNRLRRLQSHLSVTVGICALLTFIFYIIPTGMRQLLNTFVFLKYRRNRFFDVNWILIVQLEWRFRLLYVRHNTENNRNKENFDAVSQRAQTAW